MTDTPDKTGLDDLLARMRAAPPLPSADLIDRVAGQARQIQHQIKPAPRRGVLARLWQRGWPDPWRAAGGMAAAGVVGFALGLGGLLDAAVADDGGTAEMMFLPGNAVAGGALLGAGDEAEGENE